MPLQTVGNVVPVFGWVFGDATAHVIDVSARIGRFVFPLTRGILRDDVAKAYPNEPAALGSGFAGDVTLDPRWRPRRLEVWAALSDGRSLRLFRQNLRFRAADRGQWSDLRFAARLALSRPQLWLSPAAWKGGLALARTALGGGAGTGGRGAETGGRGTGSGEGALAALARARLSAFLESGSRFRLPTSDSPVVSIVTALRNRAELTLAFLVALGAHADVPFELIVVDNASNDETSTLLSRTDGVRVIGNAANVGFGPANNQGARAARGEFLLFLNNDTELLPGAMGHLVRTARTSPRIGAVGGKLIHPDGRLQEAGSIVWADGSCEGYGRGGDPSAPEYSFERDVDFCSGALLLTPRALFAELGGFDERYRPLYYEDVDYGAQLWQHGYRVVYQPKAAAIHHEFGSAASRDEGIAIQRRLQAVFIERHAAWLRSQPTHDRLVSSARRHPHGQRSLLLIDDAAPLREAGAGFPRAAVLLDALERTGYAVTVYETAPRPDRTTAAERFPTVEIVGGGPVGLRGFLNDGRRPDVVVVSRPHNMAYVRTALDGNLAKLAAPCVYDAEAVFSVRDLGRAAADGRPVDTDGHGHVIGRETELAAACAATLTVSRQEAALFEAAGVANIFVAGHGVEPEPTPASFDERPNVLFVGAFGLQSPNGDAVRFLTADILPELRKMTHAGTAPLMIAGSGLRAPSSVPSGVSYHPDVVDLTPLYDGARAFIAPTRYAAGIPLKLIEAAARGVPIVCTPLLAAQLGWFDGEAVLTAETPVEFAEAIDRLFSDGQLWRKLRSAALERVRAEYDPERFAAAVRSAVEAAREAWAAGTRSPAR